MTRSENNLTPEDVLKKMLSKDRFTEWMGISVDKVGEGYCLLHYSVKEEMLNGFGSIHGGILFSAADSAFAFACNSRGFVTVALDVSISFTRPVYSGEKLIVEAKEVHIGNKTGVYEVRTLNEKKELVCLFKGTAYKTSRLH